jgi:hypothetical protein
MRRSRYLMAQYSLEHAILNDDDFFLLHLLGSSRERMREMMVSFVSHPALNVVLKGLHIFHVRHN